MKNNNVFPLNGQPEPATPASSGDRGGGNYDARLARLETHIKYLATKEDIESAKVWFLKTSITVSIIAFIAVSGLMLAIFRNFLA